MYCQLYTREEGRFFFNFHFADTALVEISLRRQNEQQYRSPRLPPFFSASIREGRVALSVGHPRGKHSRYVIGCCLIPLGSMVSKITRDELPMEQGVYGGCLLCPLYPLLPRTDSSCFLLTECELTNGLPFYPVSHRVVELCRKTGKTYFAFFLFVLKLLP